MRELQDTNPWRPRVYPDIDQGMQTDSLTPSTSISLTSSTSLPLTLPPNVDKKNASTQLPYNDLMLKLHQLMTRNAINL